MKEVRELLEQERVWGRLREEDFQQERRKVREVLQMIEECSRLLDERMREVIGHWAQLERFRRGPSGRSLFGEVRDRVSIYAEAKRRQIVSRFASQVVDEVTN